MQGHIPVPPQPHVPYALSPIIGYLATREPQPLDGRPAVELEWWEVDDEETALPPARHSTVIKATAVIVSFSLLLAGIGTLLEIVLSAH